MPSLRDLRVDLKGFTPAEEQFLREHAAGEIVVLGHGKTKGKRLSKASPERVIRTAFIRHFMLGGCPALPCHKKGVQIAGAWIPDALDLEGCDAPRDLVLISSRFAQSPNFATAHLRGLYLDGSLCPGLDADRLRVTGNVHLRNGFEAEGEVRLLGAKIGGNLSCISGKFRNGGGNAISADRIETGGDVFLRDGFEAEGEVCLLGAKIGGDLACVCGKFRNNNGNALSADKVEVKGSFFLRGGAVVEGVLDLTRARFGGINDDRACWPKQTGWLVLDGCSYDAIIGGPVDAETRLEWLALQDPSKFKEDFWPQPYEQLAKVFRAMGHAEDARKVLVEKERLQRADRWNREERQRKDLIARRDAATDDHDHQTQRAALGRFWLHRRSHRGWDWLLAKTVGYGYRPVFALYLTFGLIAMATVLYFLTWWVGGLAPNSDVVLLSRSWAEAMAARPDAPSRAWVEMAEGRHYETFNAFAYAMDVILPVISFGQEAAWAPTTAKGFWSFGTFAWFTGWLFRLLGWIITALGAAAITGIIRRE